MSTDSQLCEYASANGFVLVSKDDDFQALVASRAYRPKLVLLALVNATNDQVLAALLGAADRIETALSQTDIGIAVIDRTNSTPS